MNTNGKVKTKAIDERRPHNIEAEEATLGAAMIDRDGVIKIPFLEPSDFFILRNNWIWAAIVDLHHRHKPADLVTLCDELERRGQLDEVGGPAHLTSLMSITPTSANVVHYAKIVKRTALLRAVIDKSSEAIVAAYADINSVEEITGSLKANITEIEKHIATDDGSTYSKERAGQYYIDILERRVENRDEEKLQFPWRGLSNLMPYLDNGTLVGIAAGPGDGKTVFMENCAEAWAKRGWRVALYHLELSSQMMLDRRMQRMTGVSIKVLQSGKFTDEVWQRIINTAKLPGQWPGELYYIHCPGWSAGQIIAHAQKLHDAAGIDVIIIDYFNKMAMINRDGLNSALSREQDIETIKVALERNGWVGLMAAQFDKATRRENGFRTLADVKETSALEDKANVGIVIRRDRDKNGNRPDDAVISVVKCNAGQEGSVNMVFKGERLAFYPVVSDDSVTN